jgi:hypothetical protein
MSTITHPEIPLSTDNPAQRLRRTAAAVRVHFTWWGVHKMLTAQQKEEVGLAYDADSRLLSAGKKIIDVRHPAYRRLTAVRSQIASYWRGLTLPYVEPGMRLIRQADVGPFDRGMAGYRAELAQAETDLDTAYAEIQADARQRLGRLYNPADYPPALRGLFGVTWDYPSVEPPAYLLRIAPDVYAQEQQRVAARFEEAVRLAEEAFIAELARLVSHLTERLASGADGQRKVFRDSTLNNLRDFFERFRSLSIRSNAQLDALIEQAQGIVGDVHPDSLRDNAALRQHVATQLSQVQATLDGLLVDQPRRRLLRRQGGDPA